MTRIRSPGDPKRLRQVLLVEERDLRRGPHREVAARVPLGDRRHRPEARRGDVVQPIRPLDDRVGLAERPVDVTGGELVREVHQVPRELRVDPRRVRPERLRRIEHRRQLLVRDVDQPARLRRDLLGLGRHRRHLVADAADHVALEGQVVLRVAERALLDVPARDHAEHPGQRLGPARVDPRDARVRHRACAGSSPTPSRAPRDRGGTGRRPVTFSTASSLATRVPMTRNGRPPAGSAVCRLAPRPRGPRARVAHAGPLAPRACARRRPPPRG